MGVEPTPLLFLQYICFEYIMDDSKEIPTVAAFYKLFLVMSKLGFY